MGVAQVDPGDVTGSHVKIGSESHLGRNTLILLAAAGGLAAILAYQSVSSRNDTQKLEGLVALRSAFAERCEAPAWAEPPAPMVRDVFVRSPRLQQVVEQQLNALNGGASCEQVYKALKAADLPLPPLTAN